MENLNLETYKDVNLPKYLRERLATAPQEEKPTVEEEPQTQPSAEAIQENPSEAVSEPSMVVEEQAQATPPEEQESNEAKAWKGRLNKTQSELKTANERLLAEAAARQQAEQERAALAQQIAELTKAKEESSKAKEMEEEKVAPSQPYFDDFTDEELTSLRLQLGEGTANKLLQRLTTSTSQQLLPDVTKAIDERFNEMQQRQTESARREAFGKALSEQVPDLQGLLTNPQFVQFANEKVVDYMGNTASTLLNHVGKTMDIGLLPKVKAIIAEFTQSQNKPEYVVTAPPVSKSAVVNTTENKKPKPKPADLAQMKRLMVLGEVDKLREFQEKFDLD